MSLVLKQYGFTKKYFNLTVKVLNKCKILLCVTILSVVLFQLKYQTYIFCGSVTAHKACLRVSLRVSLFNVKVIKSIRSHLGVYLPHHQSLTCLFCVLFMNVISLKTHFLLRSVCVYIYIQQRASGCGVSPPS